MGEDLPKNQVKWLTYLVLLLLTILTGVTVMQNASISDMQTTVNALPKEYVQLERYKTDQDRQISTLDKIDAKLDRLIMSGGKN